ncbi:MAG: hypothetical protein AAFP87_20470 [Pseudomonadota bacterium]
MRALRMAAIAAVERVFGRQHTDELCSAWREIASHPSVVSDLVTLGHLFEDQLINPETGAMYSADERLVRAARKSLVLQLLARAEITYDELNFIRKTGDTGDEILAFDDSGDAVFGAGEGTE